MAAPELTIRPGHPDFLDLPWEESLADWDDPRLVELPKGISRHEVRFLQYPEGLYAVKELPTSAARQDYGVLRSLDAVGGPAVRPVGLVERRHPDSHSERSAALITAYEPYSFSYRELLQGPGFGRRRNQMLDAFAGLLVELHLAGVYWGDCSLSNVLYRYDAEAIETVMVDAETAEVFGEGRITDGRRLEDIEIMIVNVAGGMADIAAAHGISLDEADLTLGEDIAHRYRALWAELTTEPTIAGDERYLIRRRIARLNDLGFNVEEIALLPQDEGGSRLRMKVRVGGRTFHQTRLRELSGIEALEHQAKQILADLYYYRAQEGVTTGMNVDAVRWRVSRFEPMLERLRRLDGVSDPVQAYCDLLVHRYLMSERAGRDVGVEPAWTDWLDRGRPGYPLPDH